MEAAVGSQPGVLHIEAHWPQGTAVCVYDGAHISAATVVALIKERSGRAFSVVADGTSA